MNIHKNVNRRPCYYHSVFAYLFLFPPNLDCTVGLSDVASTASSEIFKVQFVSCHTFSQRRTFPVNLIQSQWALGLTGAVCWCAIRHVPPADWTNFFIIFIFFSIWNVWFFSLCFVNMGGWTAACNILWKPYSQPPLSTMQSASWTVYLLQCKSAQLVSLLPADLWHGCADLGNTWPVIFPSLRVVGPVVKRYV